MDINGFKIKQIKDNIFIIKYKINCSNFTDLWAIQCRGITLIYTDNQWFTIKMGLPRAPEIMTQYHKDGGLKVTNKEPLVNNAILSPKIDGSLLCVTLYPRTWHLTNLIADQKVINDPTLSFIIIFSTQNTFTITDDVTNNYINKAIGNKNEFIQKINVFYSLVGERPITICFEAVCAFRTGMDGVKHSEYAINYSNDSCTFIAYTDLESQQVFYHHQVKQNIWEEPVTIIAKNNSELNQIMKSLSTSINESCAAHPEGYIVYSGNDVYKIKTIEYYDSHTERKDSKSAERMFAIGFKLGNTFPNAESFYKLFNEFREILANVRCQLQNLLTDSTVISRLSSNLLEKMKTFSNRRKLMIIFNTVKGIEFEVIDKHFNFQFHAEAKYYREFMYKLQDGLTFDQEYEFYLLYKKNKRLSITPKILGAYVFGCRKSTDTDIAVVVENLDDIDKYIEHRVTEQVVRDIMGNYIDPNKSLDICFISIENLKDEIPLVGFDTVTPTFRINKVSKGGKEIQNMIVKTWSSHPQKYQLVLTPVHLDTLIQDKIMALVKFIVDNFEVLVPEEVYQKYRMLRSNSYKSYLGKLEFMKTVYKEIVKFQNSLNTEFLSAIKSIVMKCIQIIISPTQIYDKMDLAAEIDRLYPNTLSVAEYLLFRGEIGSSEGVTEFLEFLFCSVFKMIENDFYEVKWISLKPNLENPTIFDNSTFQEFITSPSIPTNKFIDEYGSKTLNTVVHGFSPISINKMFISDNQNIDLLPKNIVAERIIDVKQKSQEWLELNKLYKCGLNTGVNKFDGEGYEFVSFYYNLIRGAIGEQIASSVSNVELMTLFPGAESVNKIFVGMVVEKKIQVGSTEVVEGASPDMILQVNYFDCCEYVPVEIKCHDTEIKNNKDMRRCIGLATKQLQTSARLLGDEIACKNGVLLVLSVTDEKFYLDATVINL
jgi:hypothetical protein